MSIYYSLLLNALAEHSNLIGQRCLWLAARTHFVNIHHSHKCTSIKICPGLFYSPALCHIRYGAISEKETGKSQKKFFLILKVKKMNERKKKPTIHSRHVPILFVFWECPALARLPSWSYAMYIKLHLHLLLYCPRGLSKWIPLTSLSTAHAFLISSAAF